MTSAMESSVRNKSKCMGNYVEMKLRRLAILKDKRNETRKLIDEESVPLCEDEGRTEELCALYLYGKSSVNSLERKALMFVVLFIFCPSALVGMTKIKKGIRDRIAKALNCHPTMVSHYCGNLMFTYMHYRDFQEKANEILEIFKNMLND